MHMYIKRLNIKSQSYFDSVVHAESTKNIFIITHNIKKYCENEFVQSYIFAYLSFFLHESG
uniref:Uncharacterized protein n=1 Tax=Octopus bimaculoides TaxID=37653 RepID=A0A0L8FY25_OCTBM